MPGSRDLKVAPCCRGVGGQRSQTVSEREAADAQTGTLGSCWSNETCWRPCGKEFPLAGGNGMEHERDGA